MRIGELSTNNKRITGTGLSPESVNKGTEIKMLNDGKNIQRNLLFRNTNIKKNNGFEYGLSDW